MGHLDGAENLVGAILADAEDLSALSDELASHDDVWGTRYHLARARGNIMRALDLPAGATVLEIGCGCGAVTRYLGERCDRVDALEPTPERARLARLRTRDLDSVEVFIGSLEAIPPRPAYDLIVLVGVLEYVGGPRAWGERVRFLREAASRLNEGGTIACAIENRFGAQYLAGAPEEHLGRAFVGLEGYPEGGHVRTFSRAELERLFAEAGLEPSVHGVLPDYKFARLVFSDSMLDSDARSLAWSVSQMPSRSSPHARQRLASELHLWRGLVDAGLGGHTANSFLVLATRGGVSPLWPAERSAVFFSGDRRAAYATETRLELRSDGLGLARRRLSAGLAPPAGSLRQRIRDARWVSGTALLDVLESCDMADLSAWLWRWRASVQTTLVESDGATNVDLVPHNYIVRRDGALARIDQEWFDATYTADEVISRGLVTCALALTERRPPSDWPGCETVDDVVRRVLRLGGVDASKLASVLDREAVLQAQMAGKDPRTRREALQAALDQRLSQMPLGDREAEMRALADAAARSAQEAHENAAVAIECLNQATEHAQRRHDEELSALSTALDELHRRYDTVITSRSWRMTAVVRRIARNARRTLN